MNTIASLAILRVDVNAGKDYVDYLVPFVCEVLRLLEVTVVTSKKVQEGLEHHFGLLIPKYSVELVLKRLHKRKVVVYADHQYTVKAKIPEGGFNARRAKASRLQQAFISALREYAKERFELDWPEESAISAILSYLSQFSIDCLAYYHRGSALPDIQQSSERDMFILNSFLKGSESKFGYQRESFVEIIQGHMLANALLCEDMDSIQRKFEGVIFYIDTPIIICLLGLNGVERHDAASELLMLLRKLKGTLGIFEFTIDEIERVLEYFANNIQNIRNNDDSIDELKRLGFTRADILALSGEGLIDFLDELNIVRHSSPAHVALFQIDEVKLQANILQSIHYRSGTDGDTVKHDVNLISSIFALRKGENPRSLERAKAVGVTSNSQLAHVAHDFGKSEGNCSNVGPLLSDFSLTNIAWLKSPLEASALPKLEMHAACYAAMQPEQTLWAQYLREIEILKEKGSITAEEHAMLRSTKIAKDELMNSTLGSVEEFDSLTVPNIIAKVKNDWLQAEHEQLAEERSRRSEAEGQRDALKDRHNLVEAKIDRFARFLAAIVTWAIKVILLLGVLSTGISAFLPNSNMDKTLAVVFFVLFVVGSIIAWLGDSFGIDVTSITRAIYSRVHRLALRLAYKVIFNEEQ